MAELPPLAGGVSGNTAAEKAGNSALRSDALSDRATVPKATMGPTDKVLSQAPLQQQTTAAKPTCTLTRDQFHDKVMGMMLMGALGDALGAAHEVLGLEDHVAADLVSLDLRAYEIYKDRKVPEPFGVWPKALNSDLGMVTDDTGVRVMMLHQWLRFHEERDEYESSLPPPSNVLKPSEASYEEWLQGMHNEPAWEPPLQYKAVFEMRKEVINEILTWLSKERASRTPPLKGPAVGTTANTPLRTTKSTFWDPTAPVVFGQFLYLELASIYFGCERATVLAEFKNFSILDHGYAGFSTGMLAAILAQAIRADPVEDFAVFFIRQAEELLKPPAPKELIDAWQLGKAVGIANRDKKTLREFENAIQTDIFKRCNKTTPQGRGKFDTAMFLKQMSAAVHWGTSCYEALCVLAFGVGDSDTIPAQLGSIMGAYYGEKKWRTVVDINRRFTTVQTGVEKYFAASAYPAGLTGSPAVGEAEPFRYSEVADCLVKLASRHGCCDFR